MRMAGWICLVLALLAAPARAEPIWGEYPLSVWLGFLEDPSPDKRLQAISAVAILAGQESGTVPRLWKALDGLNRDQAHRAIKLMTPLEPEALPDLIASLADSVPVGRLAAVRVMGRLTGSSRDAALGKALSDPDPEVRLAAAEGLVPKEVARPAVLAVLIDLVEKEVNGLPLRIKAAHLLGQLGPEAAPAVAALRKLLRDPGTDENGQTSARAAAAEALRHLGPSSRAAVPDLRDQLTLSVRSLREEEAGVRIREERLILTAALLALGDESDGVYSTLLGILEFTGMGTLNGDYQLPRILALLLTGREPKDEAGRAAPRLRCPVNRRALPVFVRALGSPRDGRRAAAARILSHFDLLPAEVVVQLRELAAEDVSSAVRRRAAIALCRLPGALREADGEELLASLDSVKDVQWTYYWEPEVIPALAAAADITLPLVLRALKNERPGRAALVEILALMAQTPGDAPRLRPAIPILKELARSREGPDLTTTGLASFTLVRLGVDRSAHLETFFHTIGHSDCTRLLQAYLSLLPSLDDREIALLLAAMDKTEVVQNHKFLHEISTGKTQAALLAALARDLERADDKVRCGAADRIDMLSRYGADLQPAVPALLKALEDRCPQMRLFAARHLVEAKRYEDQVRPMLLELLENHNEERATAARVLCQISLPPTKAPALLRLAAQYDEKEVLWAYFRAAPDALGPLGALLEHPDPNRRRWAAKTLQSLGPAGHKVLGQIVAQAEPGARRLAAETLEDCPTIPASAVASLRQVLTDPDPQLAGRAAAALAWNGRTEAPVVSVLLRELQTGDLGTRRLAAKALGESQSQVEAVSAALGHALRDEDALVRKAAVNSLARLGQGALGQLPALLHCCSHDPRPRVYQSAIWAVGSIASKLPRSEQPAAIRHLLALLSTSDPDECHAIVSALGCFPLGEMRPLVLPALTSVLEMPDHPTRAFAANFLANSQAEALPYLDRLLQSSQTLVRRNAFLILQNVKADAAQLLPLLRQGLNDRSAEVRKAGYETLAQRKEAALALPLLRNRLGCLPAVERVEALRVLAAVGPAAREALPLLLPELKHADDAVRWAALNALIQLAPGATETLPALAAMLKDKTPEICSLALEGLNRLGPPACPFLLQAVNHDNVEISNLALKYLAEQPRLPAEALPPLVAKLQKSEASTVALAARALARLNEAGAPAVPVLTAALRNPDVNVRTAGAAALGAIGQSSPSVLAELKALRRDRHEPVRRAAAAALAKLSSVGK